MLACCRPVATTALRLTQMSGRGSGSGGASTSRAPSQQTAPPQRTAPPQLAAPLPPAAPPQGKRQRQVPTAEELAQRAREIQAAKRRAAAWKNVHSTDAPAAPRAAPRARLTHGDGTGVARVPPRQATPPSRQVTPPVDQLQRVRQTLVSPTADDTNGTDDSDDDTLAARAGVVQAQQVGAAAHAAAPQAAPQMTLLSGISIGTRHLSDTRLQRMEQLIKAWFTAKVRLESRNVLCVLASLPVPRHACALAPMMTMRRTRSTCRCGNSPGHPCRPTSKG